MSPVNLPLGGRGGGGGGGGGKTIIINPNVSFEITPTFISKFAEPGESKPIIATVEGYTFLIKNTGPEPIFIEVRIEGDYKDWVSIGGFAQMLTYQIPQYISIDPGKTEGVKLYTKIPITAKTGTYQITIIFMDRDSKIYKSATINLVVSPINIIYTRLQLIYDKISYPIIFSTSATTPQITKEGIVIPARSNVTIPIGWLIVILAYVITFYLIKAIVGYRRRDLEVKKWVLHLVSLGVSLIVLVMI